MTFGPLQEIDAQEVPDCATDSFALCGRGHILSDEAHRLVSISEEDVAKGLRKQPLECEFRVLHGEPATVRQLHE